MPTAGRVKGFARFRTGAAAFHGNPYPPGKASSLHERFF
jgi:hypothetical protein